MSNLCYTDIKITGKDTKKFYDFIEKVKNTPWDVKQDYGDLSLYKLLLNAGYTDKELDSLWWTENVNGRGCIDGYQYSENLNTLMISTETANTSSVGTFKVIAMKLGLTVDIDYFIDCSDFGEYAASTKEMVENADYYVDYGGCNDFLTKYDEDPFTTEQDLRDTLSLCLASNKPLEELIEDILDLEEDMSINSIDIEETIKVA